MLIKLNEKAEQYVNGIIEEAKELGLKKKHWHEILSALVLEIPQKNILELAKEQVPDDIVIQKGLLDDELKREIALLIRKRAEKKAEAVS